ncbi:uncharacterized protein LOC142321545 isoform X4 [Lycorma delicatula]|uniref:uncharacterized protein LOC142321545 isoform X4 n=1 Tax=Lycorma delicatula TaxID=130591 RepID=UPI003F51348B
MMKKSLCVSKNNKQPSNKLSLSSSATTTIFSAGIKVAITSLFVIVFSAPINEAAVIQDYEKFDLPKGRQFIMLFIT